MGKSVVTPDKVTFSAGAQLYVGDVGTDPSALVSVGLLKADATLNPTQTTRDKMDQFPNVVVARSIQQQELQIQLVVREWKKSNLQLAFGLDDDDVTNESGDDTAVTGEAHTFNDNDVIVLKQPLKSGETATVKNGATTYTAGTDYVVVPRDVQGRTLIYRLSAGSITANEAVTVDYTYNLPTRNIYPIGKRATVVYHAVKLVEDYTNGNKMELVMWKAQVGINGNIDINSAENGADLPLTIAAIYDPTNEELAQLSEYVSV